MGGWELREDSTVPVCALAAGMLVVYRARMACRQMWRRRLIYDGTGGGGASSRAWAFRVTETLDN